MRAARSPELWHAKTQRRATIARTMSLIGLSVTGRRAVCSRSG
ncbi:hypothetical protein SAMN05660880_03609, partial [Luteibacter sp. 22Crub2.1]